MVTYRDLICGTCGQVLGIVAEGLDDEAPAVRCAECARDVAVAWCSHCGQGFANADDLMRAPCGDSYCAECIGNIVTPAQAAYQLSIALHHMLSSRSTIPYRQVATARDNGDGVGRFEIEVAGQPWLVRVERSPQPDINNEVEQF